MSPTPANEFELYHPDQFVGREETIKKIMSWLVEPNPLNSLWAIVGTAGIGKSWLLHEMQKRLDEKPNYRLLRLDMSMRTSMNSRIELITEEGRKDWFRQLEVWGRDGDCSDLGRFDYDAPFESLLETFLKRMCENCSPQVALILVVDGLDEATSEECLILEERILVNFLNIPCFRILLAYRDEYSLQEPYLKRRVQIENLGVFEKSEGREQLQRLFDSKDSDAIPEHFSLDEFTQSMNFYRWNHPAINANLFATAINGGPVVLRRPDVQTCLQFILEPISLEPDSFNLLVDLAHLKESSDGWTEKELRDKLGIGIDNGDLERLFQAGVIYHVPRTQRYQVASGIWELLRDYQTLTD